MTSTAIFIPSRSFFVTIDIRLIKSRHPFKLRCANLFIIVTFFFTPINTSMDPAISYNEKSSFV